MNKNNGDRFEDWHIIKNEGLSPADVKELPKKMIQWMCKEGHKWETSIDQKNMENGCPYCTRKQC